MATTKARAQLLLDATSPRIVTVPLPTNVTADWTTNVTGTGKPADNATVNRVTYSNTAPSSPVNGDIWVDTSTSPHTLKTRVGGAWVASSTYTTNTNQLTDGANLGGTATWGGVSGTGKPSDYADVTTTILTASGTSVVMTNAQLFKSASGTAGVFIGSAGIVGKDSGGNTTFSISGSTGAATFAGSLSAATGSFAGSLSAATGSFAGSLSAATGSFAGSLSAATGSFAGSLSAATGSFAGSLNAVTGSFGAVTAGGAVTVNSSGSISNGISYGSTGFFLGYSGGAYKFSVGDATKYLRWDGSALTFTGALSAATGTFAGTLSAATGTFAGTLSAATGTFAGTLSAACITSGTMSASRINGGTFSGANIQIASSESGWLLNAGNNGTVVYYRRLEGYNIYAGNGATPGSSPVTGDSGTAAAGVYGTSSGSGGHGLRGEAGNGLGFVGYNGGTYDFYAYGSASNYGPFTGAHDALIDKRVIVQAGDIVCDLGVAVRKNVSNTICFVAPSTEAEQGAAVGVVCTLPETLESVHALPAAMMDRMWTTQPDGQRVENLIPCREWIDLRLTHNKLTMNALGEGQINVCGLGGNLMPGGLITTSALPGKGQRQSDDVVRASSVAKCREAVTFDYPEQVKQVACIYLCG